METPKIDGAFAPFFRWWTARRHPARSPDRSDNPVPEIEGRIMFDRRAVKAFRTARAYRFVAWTGLLMIACALLLWGVAVARRVSAISSLRASGCTVVLTPFGPSWLRERMPSLAIDAFGGIQAVGARDIGPSTFRRVGYLGAVSTVYLSGSACTDETLQGMFDLSAVEYADFSDTSVTDLTLRRLGHNDRVWSIRVARTRITNAGIASLCDCNSLQVLDVSGTAVSHLHRDAAPMLSRLNSLNVSNTRVGDDGIQSLRDVSSMCCLDLSDTLITDDGIECLRSLVELTDLSVAGTRVTDKGMAIVAELPQLESLNISRTTVSDAGLQAILRCPRMMILSAEATCCSSSGCEALVRAHGGLSRVSFSK